MGTLQSPLITGINYRHSVSTMGPIKLSQLACYHWCPQVGSARSILGTKLLMKTSLTKLSQWWRAGLFSSDLLNNNCYLFLTYFKLSSLTMKKWIWRVFLCKLNSLAVVIVRKLFFWFVLVFSDVLNKNSMIFNLITIL